MLLRSLLKPIRVPDDCILQPMPVHCGISPTKVKYHCGHAFLLAGALVRAIRARLGAARVGQPVCQQGHAEGACAELEGMDVHLHIMPFVHGLTQDVP